MDKKNDANELPFKPLSAKQFLDFFPVDLSEDEKEELAAEMEQSSADYQIETEDERRFRQILKSVNRDGTERILDYLKYQGFFTAPGSVVHHSNWKGGLVNHSLKVYDCAMRLKDEMIQKDPSLASELTEDHIAIASLLHDVCKADEYKIDVNGKPTHKESMASLGGHGSKSVILLLFHGYALTWDEVLAIRWHMGASRIKEPKEKKECERAKQQSALVRLLIRADYTASKSRPV